MTCEEKQKIKPKQINIFGSCVTRDVFEFDSNKRFRVGEYIARQSIISFLSRAVELQEDEIKLTSNFQKKQLISDWSKDGIERFKRNMGDYLIIDLIDERFKIGKVAGSYVTDSNELEISGLLDNYKIKMYDKKFFGGRLYFRHRKVDKYITKFIDEILKVYNQEQLIIHEVYLAEYFLDKNGDKLKFPQNWLLYVQMLNEKLNYMYMCLRKSLPYAYCITISDHFCADEMHKWGLAPMHYEYNYYKAVLEKLYQLS